MHQQENKTWKKSIYLHPDIEIVVLDNDISLALQSYPPNGPDEEDPLYGHYNPVIQGNIMV